MLVLKAKLDTSNDAKNKPFYFYNHETDKTSENLTYVQFEKQLATFLSLGILVDQSAVRV